VDAYKSSLCPSPWRVPSQRDFDDLDWAFVVASKSIAVDKSVPALYQTEWGPVYGGYAVGNGGNGIGECCTWARYWSTTESTDEVGSALVISNVGYHASGHTNSKTVGYQVRCVK
jgi:uncharacterized protein (TIGR02145 family)